MVLVRNCFWVTLPVSTLLGSAPMSLKDLAKKVTDDNHSPLFPSASHEKGKVIIMVSGSLKPMNGFSRGTPF